MKSTVRGIRGRWRAWSVWLSAVVAGCVTGSYSHETFDEPIADVVLQALRPGHDDLTACLKALGAPHHVFEYGGGRTSAAVDGMALLWVWRDTSGWGFELQSPSDTAPGSFAFTTESAELPACVLWFDGSLVLERWRSGTVGELLPDRVRPSSPRIADAKAEPQRQR